MSNASPFAFEFCEPKLGLGKPVGNLGTSYIVFKNETLKCLLPPAHTESLLGFDGRGRLAHSLCRLSSPRSMSGAQRGSRQLRRRRRPGFRAHVARARAREEGKRAREEGKRPIADPKGSSIRLLLRSWHRRRKTGRERDRRRFIVDEDEMSEALVVGGGVRLVVGRARAPLSPSSERLRGASEREGRFDAHMGESRYGAWVR